MLVKILEGGIVQETEVGFLFRFFFSSRSLVLLLSRIVSPRYQLLLAWANSTKIMHASLVGGRVKANNFWLALVLRYHTVI